MNSTETTLYLYLKEWLEDTYDVLHWPLSQRVSIDEIWTNWEIGEQLRAVAAIADGGATSLPLEGVSAACDLLFKISNGNAAVSSPTWWDTPVGQIVLKVHLALSGDELITSSTAANIIGVDLPILNLIATKKRALQGYSLDPKIVKNPQRRMRFLRDEVEEYARINPPEPKQRRMKKPEKTKPL